MGVLYRASMQHHICLLLWTPVTIMTLTAMVTRLAIHPGETEAEWMTVTVAFTQGSVSVTKAFRSETTHRHTHALETSKTITGIDRVNCVWLSIWRVYSASECISYKSQDCEQLDTTSDQSCIKSEWEKEKTTSVFTTQQANTWKAIKVWNCTVKLSQLTFTRLSAARRTVRHFWLTTWQMQVNNKDSGLDATSIGVQCCRFCFLTVTWHQVKEGEFHTKLCFTDISIAF